MVVDGSPTDGTVLTLTHWPGFPSPEGLERDLSAEMAFAYLRDDRDLHSAAQAVSNNHFDQDGLVGVFALVEPEAALAREPMLVDIASAGDFGTYAERGAARASMVIARWANDERADLPDAYEDRAGVLYEEALGRLPELCDHPDRYRDLWEEEDATLSQSEELVASDAVTIDEHHEIDLAVFDVPASLELAGGHRFAGQWTMGLHPMAINNATSCGAILVRQGQRYDMTYRYESWVQYRTRQVRPRRDLSLLAATLTSEEASGGTWVYDGSGGLTPRLHLADDGESTLTPDRYLELLTSYLLSAPPNWDPYAPKE